MHRKPEPLYGAPRGNAVMAAKRTRGPSPNTELTLRVRSERCTVQGCTERPLLSRTKDGTILRRCKAHAFPAVKPKARAIIGTAASLDAPLANGAPWHWSA